MFLCFVIDTETIFNPELTLPMINYSISATSQPISSTSPRRRVAWHEVACNSRDTRGTRRAFRARLELPRDKKNDPQTIFNSERSR